MIKEMWFLKVHCRWVFCCKVAYISMHGYAVAELYLSLDKPPIESLKVCTVEVLMRIIVCT